MSEAPLRVAASAGTELLVTIDRVSQMPALDALRQVLAAQGVRPRVVALELEVFEALRSGGITADYLDDLVDPGIHDRVDREAGELAHGWFRVPCGSVIRDLTCYCGVSLGRLVAWEMTYFFAEVLRCRRNVDALLALTRPAAVLALAEPAAGDSLLLHPSENFHHDALRAACAALGIPCELSAPPSVAPASHPDFDAAVAIPRLDDEVGETGYRAAGATVLSAGVQAVTRTLVDRLFDRDFERLLVLGHAAGLDQGDPRISATSAGCHARPGDGARASVVLRRRWRSRGSAMNEALVRRAPMLGDVGCVERRLRYLFHERLAQAYRLHLQHRRLLGETDVGAVLLHNDVTEEGRSLALAARGAGIPSLVLLHGAIGHPVGALPVAADRIGVYGPHFTRWFRDHGVAAERLVEIGSPRFGEIHPARRRRLRDETRARLGVGTGRRLVVLALQHCNRATWFANVHWSHREWRRLVHAVLEATARRSDVHLLVKLHPSAEDAALWAAWLAGRAALAQELPGESLLAAADALVTGWSTLGLEAVLAGVPLLTANFTDRPTPIEFARLGLSDHVDHPDKLAAALDCLLSAPRRVSPQDLDHVLGRRGDAAASRTADVVSAHVRERRSRLRMAPCTTG